MQAGAQDLRPAEAGEEPGPELKRDAALPLALEEQKPVRSHFQFLGKVGSRADDDAVVSRGSNTFLFY